MRARMRPILFPRMLATVWCLLLATRGLCPAAEPVWPDWRNPLIFKFVDELKDADAKMKTTATPLAVLSRRGDLHLFLGQFPEAIADFRKMIEIDPAQDGPHWRLGIAYYFAGQYADSVRQFEKYHAYDGQDRENGIWKFLAQAKLEGIEKARAEMITYKEFDREPFPTLYDMFAGKFTPDAVVAEMKRTGLDKDRKVAFFAYFYAGFDAEVLGHRQEAIDLLRPAVDLMPEPDTVYMWNVARLEWERLVTEQAHGR